ncbi:hypothetical protein D9M72_640980 [compost metagenome]
MKVSQFRIALSAVCSIFTWVLPPAALCTGALALAQPAVRLFASIFRPPSVSPSGTEPSFSAACRAPACAACCAAMVCAARFRLLMERCHCGLSAFCRATGLVRLDAGWPFGR